MARIRTIKPEFWSSPDTARATPLARLLYIAMWTWADDYGVGTANLKELAAFAFPNDDNIGTSEIQSLCKEVAGSFGTAFYTHHGRPYYCIPAWDAHQKTERRAKGRNPRPEDAESTTDLRMHNGEAENLGTSSQCLGKSPVGTGEQGNRGTGEEETCSPAPPSNATEPTTPPGFAEFWNAYPRKEAKQAALKAWPKAVKLTSRTTLIEGALRLAQDPNREDEFTPLPASWLNAGRWEDDPLPTRNSDTPRPRPSTADTTIAQLQARKNPFTNERKAIG